MCAREQLDGVAVAPSGSARRGAAHRPSRRDDIVAAAVSVFAECGYAEASIADIAAVAKVAVSGVYYHFPTKSQLFDEAMAEVYRSLGSAVAASVDDGVPSGSAEELAAAIHAGYKWADDHRDGARLLFSHLPGATPEGARLRDKYEARHVAGARRFLEQAARGGASAPVGSPAAQLAVRTLVRTMLTTMPRLLEGGLFSKRSSRLIEVSLQAVAIHIVYS